MSQDRFAALCAVAGTVSRETFERLEAFERIFLRWADRMNLAAPSTLTDVWSRHILDSAQLAGLTKAMEIERWVDIGSGGGFPGAILGILAEGHQARSVTLVESNAKKASFLRNALAELAPSAQIICDRAENYIATHAPPDAVSARAVASLSALVSLCESWLGSRTIGFFHKGRDYRAELKLATDTWNLDLVEHKSAVDAGSVILEIRSVRRRV
ncbi:16S rRNA (guanine(527)-N(7))-methyltransferase RsmG [Aquibium sp. LZ166]|uniref:Ribosomal RNA small subunit methyltransferase G n=1 Tax=Aquibium pacificus TaxID=3153579 RepID=A0ABV3SG03_9HYPH